MPADVKWHFIGHLQTNKARKLLETRNLFVVETVDSEKVAKALNKQLEVNKTAKFNETLQGPLNVFVQVKTSDEDSKSGVEPDECATLVQLIMEQLPNLKVCGLMTIGKLHGDPTEDFNRLKSTRSIVATQLQLKEDDLELSMGMSGDFETAVRFSSPFLALSGPISSSHIFYLVSLTLLNLIVTYCADCGWKYERTGRVFDFRYSCP